MAGGAQFDVAVIGGGLVGAAIAFGLRKLGARLLVRRRRRRRAARGARQLRPRLGAGQGRGMSALRRVDAALAREWPRFAAELFDASGHRRRAVAARRHSRLPRCGRTSPPHRRARGARRAAGLRSLRLRGARSRRARAAPAGSRGRRRRRHLVPARRALQSAGAALRAAHGARPRRLRLPAGCAGDPDQRPFRSLRPARPRRDCCRPSAWCWPQGSATLQLAPMVGLTAPLRPQQGQVLVLERVRPFLPLPLSRRCGRPTTARC